MLLSDLCNILIVINKQSQSLNEDFVILCNSYFIKWDISEFAFFNRDNDNLDFKNIFLKYTSIIQINVSTLFNVFTYSFLFNFGFISRKRLNQRILLSIIFYIKKLVCVPKLKIHISCYKQTYHYTKSIIRTETREFYQIIL